MQTDDSSNRMSRACGRVFAGMAAISAVLSGIAFHSRDWRYGLRLLLGAVFLGFIAWVGFAAPISPSKGGDDRGKQEAGRLVPLKPSPTHHLVGAKDLPPSDNTHSFPKD